MRVNYIKTIDGYQRYLPLDHLCWYQRMGKLAEQHNYRGRKNSVTESFDFYVGIGFSRSRAYFEACKTQCLGNSAAKCKRNGLNVDSRNIWKPTDDN
jgi:hypothetical protein